MSFAPGTIRGSAVSIPSTSVQISMASAASAPPISAPVKSDPPRPSVVVMPAWLDAMKPPIRYRVVSKGISMNVYQKLLSDGVAATRIESTSIARIELSSDIIL